MVNTINRVPLHTDWRSNRRIEVATGQRIQRCASNPHEIDRRLRDLDREWDIERVLEANASALAFAGIAMASGGNRRWLLLPGLVTAFLFPHAVQGWCPPISLLRRMGIRTAREIEIERVALKLLRGDFDDTHAGGASFLADRALRAAKA